VLSLKFINENFSPLKIPSLNKVCFQDRNSPIIEQLIFFHNHTLLILILIISIVGFSLISTIANKNLNLQILEAQEVELFWTVAPMAILLAIGFPSIRILYLIDEVYSPLITLKTLGHQWYWRYEYSDFPDKEFDSYIIPLNSRGNNSIRLLEVDNCISLPFGFQVRNLVTSTDVLHSWTIPAVGVKVDAVPGRLNQLNIYFRRPGIFYGQCSEICGANHRFMPISIESVTLKDFIAW